MPTPRSDGQRLHAPESDTWGTNGILAGLAFRLRKLPKNQGYQRNCPPDLSAEWRERFRRLSAEAGALSRGYPYRNYRFLIALSDKLGNDGLEHRESTNIWLASRALRDEDYRRAYGYLIPHEYVVAASSAPQLIRRKSSLTRLMMLSAR